MRAEFHLQRADPELSGLAVEVQDASKDGIVYVRIMTGSYTDPAGAIVRHVERELTLSKSEARAIASAMMGCAAEL